MAVICPTVTAYNEHAYREQIERVSSFIERIHLDFMDGKLTPKKSLDVSQAWWPQELKADIHLMYKNSSKHIKQIIELKPDLLILHAESKGKFVQIAEELKRSGIAVGLALLKPTPVQSIEPVIDLVDHVLVFSGDLGSFGGHADMNLLKKVHDLKKLKPSLEIGWDGGINEDNVVDLVKAGVDVLNVGGAIQRADNPGLAYARLNAMVVKYKYE
jgi:ribulose-phosphate 3-epimerase